MSKRPQKIKYTKHEKGRIYIRARFNNTILSLTTENGNVLKQTSPAQCGFKNCKKQSPFATQTAITTIAQCAYENFGMRRVDVIINGPGIGRDMINFIPAKYDLLIESIIDETSPAHNGTRKKREKRN